MATRTTRLAWRLTGLAGAMALTVATVATGTLTAAAAGTSGWRIVSTVGSASSLVGDGDIVGLAPNDIWLYGSAKNNGPQTLAHWNGKSWQTVSMPHPAGGATLVTSNPVALGAKSVWLLGEVFAKSGKVSFELLHWTGRWTATAIPASIGAADQLASDGACSPLSDRREADSTHARAHATTAPQRSFAASAGPGSACAMAT